MVNTLYFAANAIRYTQEYLYKHHKGAICKNWSPVQTDDPQVSQGGQLGKMMMMILLVLGGTIRSIEAS